jgi:glycine cleavage system H protein
VTHDESLGPNVSLTSRRWVSVGPTKRYSNVMSNIREDLLYTASHEWVRVDGDVATIGITDHAQSELGDVVYVDLPSVGRKLAIGESFGSVESVKTVSDLYAPVAGEVIEVNGALGSASELVNTDPYEGGYMIKIRLDGEVSGQLLDAAGYGAVIG